MYIFAQPHKLRSFNFNNAEIKAVCLSVCQTITVVDSFPVVFLTCLAREREVRARGLPAHHTSCSRATCVMKMTGDESVTVESSNARIPLSLSYWRVQTDIRHTQVTVHVNATPTWAVSQQEPFCQSQDHLPVLQCSYSH